MTSGHEFPPPGRLEWRKGAPKSNAPFLLYRQDEKRYIMCVNFDYTALDSDSVSYTLLHHWPELTMCMEPMSPDDLWAYAAVSGAGEGGGE